MIQRFHRREPELSDFIDVVNDETLASDPLFSQEAMKEYNERQEKGTRRKLKSYVFACLWRMKGMSQVEIAVLSMKEGIIWIIGDSLMIWHWRNEVNLRKKKFCYGCYSPMTSEHNAKSCKKRWKCQICNLDYPTGLHGYIHKKKDGALTNDTEEKQGGSNLRSNFAGMVWNQPRQVLHLMSFACVLYQSKWVMLEPRSRFQHRQCWTIVVKVASWQTASEKILVQMVERLKSQSKLWMVNKRWSKQWCQDWKFEVIVMTRDGLIYQQFIPRKSFQQM